MLIICIIFLFFPLISLPILFIGFIKDKKHKIFYGIGMSFVLAIIAYYWIPENNFDLYRHHLELIQLKNYNFQYILENLSIESEPITLIIKFLISKTNNYDLLQFFITFFGYSIIFYMIGDYAIKKNLKSKYLVLILIYTLVSINYIGYISGLWNNFAFIIFAFSVYLEYILKKNKFVCYCIYIATILIHISMVFPFVLKIFYSIICKGKVNIRIITMIVILCLSISFFMDYIYELTKIDFLLQISKLYNIYFIRNAEFEYLHSGTILILGIIKIINFILIYFILLKKRELNSISNLIIIITTALSILILSSGIFIRFVNLVQLLSIMMLIDYFIIDKSKYKIVIIIYMIISIGLFSSHQYLTLKKMNFDDLFSKNYLSNVMEIFNKEN